MIFIETLIFTADLPSHLGDHEYSELQQYLAEHPEAGALILCFSDTFATDLPKRHSRLPFE